MMKMHGEVTSVNSCRVAPMRPKAAWIFGPGRAEATRGMLKNVGSGTRCHIPTCRNYPLISKSCPDRRRDFEGDTSRLDVSPSAAPSERQKRGPPLLSRPPWRRSVLHLWPACPAILSKTKSCFRFSGSPFLPAAATGCTSGSRAITLSSRALPERSLQVQRPVEAEGLSPHQANHSIICPYRLRICAELDWHVLARPLRAGVDRRIASG